MAQYTQWIEHKGKRMLFCNFAGMSETDYITGTDEMENALMAEGAGKVIPLLIDVTGSRMSGATRERGNLAVKRLSAAGIVTATAMAGISGIQKIIAQAISRDVHFANSLDEAKDWLASH